MDEFSTGSAALTLLLLLGVGSTVSASSLSYQQQQQQLTQWQDFRYRYNKTYTDVTEEFRRFQIWRENIRMIQRHNEAADRGHHSFWLKVNHMADMTAEEVDSSRKGLSVDVDLTVDSRTADGRQGGTRTVADMAVDSRTDEQVSYNLTANMRGRLPKSIDWRQKGYVTAVKFQGHCGGCYAFSATGALEGQHFRRTGKLVSLSEQNIIDCTFRNKYRNKGCHGGLMDHAFNYITRNKGVDTEQSYPYEAEVGECRFNRSNVGSKEHGYMDILPRGNERSLQVAVSQLGPASVGVDARGGIFRFYSHGVYDNLECSSRKLDHAMLAVGYGTDSSGKDYWIVKNSWGQDWGMDGYVHMARNKRNQCGIASLASIPQL